MKPVSFKVFLMIAMLSAPAAMAKSYVFDVEASGGDVHVIDGVNQKKKIIKFAGVEMYYDSSTIFYDANGNVISSESVQKNARLKFEIDPSRAYISRPTATKVWVLPPTK